MDNEMNPNSSNSALQGQDSQEQNDKKPFWKETLRLAIITLAIVIPFRYFIAQPFMVSGASMDPTFENGEYLIVDELTYRFEQPKRGDVIIFKYPYSKATYYIKRIIGLPNETVSIKGTNIKIKTAQGGILTLHEPYIQNNIPGNYDITLKNDEYYVLGDNRPASSDSRVWGPLERKFIVGTPIVRLLPLSRLELRPGEAAVLGQ